MIKINCYEDNKLIEEKSINFDIHKKEEAFLFMHNKNLGLRYVTGNYYFLDSPGLYLAEYTLFIEIKIREEEDEITIKDRLNLIEEYFSLVTGREDFVVSLRNIAYRYIEKHCKGLTQEEKCILLGISRSAYTQYPKEDNKRYVGEIGKGFWKIIKEVLIIKVTLNYSLAENESGKIVRKVSKSLSWVNLKTGRVVVIN